MATRKLKHAPDGFNLYIMGGDLNGALQGLRRNIHAGVQRPRSDSSGLPYRLQSLRNVCAHENSYDAQVPHARAIPWPSFVREMAPEVRAMVNHQMNLSGNLSVIACLRQLASQHSC
jgi:hypothetical protein